MPDEEEMTLEKLAEYAKTFFDVKTRGEGRDAERIYVMADRHPTWIYDMLFVVHDKGGWLPDDFKYEYIMAALDLLADGVDPDEPQIEPDVYTSDLMKWFTSHGNRTSYVDEAVNEFGWDKDRGVERAIAMGQLMEREEIFHMVLDALKGRLRDIELGEEEVFKKRGGGSESWQDWSPEK